MENSFAQITSGGFGDSPFERDFGDVKFLDAYFGTIDQKIEVEAGDSNVPFTVVLQMLELKILPELKDNYHYHLDSQHLMGPGSIIRADSDANSLAGENFHLTFFVNIDQ